MNTENKMPKRQLQRLCILIMAALTVAVFACLITIACLSADHSGSNTDDDSLSSGDKKDEDSISALKDLQQINVSAEDALCGSLLVINSKHSATIEEKKLGVSSIYEYRVANTSEGEIPYQIDSIYTRMFETASLPYLHSMLTALNKETSRDDIIIVSAYSNEASDEFSTGKLVSFKVYKNKLTTYIDAEDNKVIDEWLKNNAYKYGFIQRYPEGKEIATGKSGYTHCYRYVGIAHATYMHKNGLCLEEYVEMLESEKPTVSSPLTVKTTNGTYAIYYFKGENDSTEISVPASAVNPDGSDKYPYTISATNYGGIIVTVKIK